MGGMVTQHKRHIEVVAGSGTSELAVVLTSVYNRQSSVFSKMIRLGVRLP